MPDSPTSSTHPIPASFNLRALLDDPQRRDAHQGLSGGPQTADSAREESDGASRGEEPVAKRRRFATADFTRRKRAATACQFCRLRKTKCDNVRPSCGYCVRHKAKCVYGDSEWPEEGGNEQHDGIGEQILKQLKDIKDMLHCNQPSLPFAGPLNTVGPSPHTASSTIATSPELPQTGPSPWAGTTDSGSRTATNVEPSNPISRPHALARCESLLKWPVFEGMVPKEHTQVDSFLMDSDYKARRQLQGQTSTQDQARGITDDAFVPLCRKFLAHVHPRNPVLNGDELMRFARAAEEYGVKWDSQSCLVLMACALAAYTVPWKEPTPLPKDADDIQLRVESQIENRAESDAYYLAAKKRIGLLGHSILDIQCLFLASMYEKYRLQPLQAWFHLREASSRLQAHLLGQRQLPSQPGASSQHLEQRVFWSCWRAENELLLEAGLPTSGLEQLSYPDAFPAPPSDLGSSKDASPEAVSPKDHQRLIDEKGWCYYLAEIALRRSIDESIQVLYQRGDYFWLQNQDYLVRHYHEFEQQISLWHQHLPAAVQFQSDRPTDTEFSYFLHGRFSEWQELVLRPIVYYVLHSPTRAAPDTIQHAQKSINLCTMLIVKNVSQLRHGGSWFFARKSFLCACLILAVVLQPSRGLQAPSNWPSLVNISLKSLRFWGKDAEDIRRMGGILEYMYRAVCDGTR
ncbi:hypothetical protein B0T10DRAFT_161831 [Thelonectria olida]|uniref:Zn(2)-C6 fungal-type domain-containing protein n=1 Tax=Thelonectria olida TaxID=1576542 RepID=A0A9P8WDL0_9HYPO|nr:hypothetical protein B0T10DRAFT_161831 [Thelonectria olida]